MHNKLVNLFKSGLFKTVYAKGPCESNSPRKEQWHSESPRQKPCTSMEPPKDTDKCAGGDAPTIRLSNCKSSENTCSAGDRGKTGAGVTGSRTGIAVGREQEENLPAGATNPGLLRYIHNSARYRLPQCFEGGSIAVKQSTKSNNWVFGHSLSFSSVSPGGYKLLLSYANKKKQSAMPYFVMEVAPGGQLSCEMRVGPTLGTRATVVAQIADAELYSFESIIDAYFNRFTASIIAVNREFIALHYLQVLSLFWTFVGPCVYFFKYL